jgi:hypothetical protein
MDEAQQMQDQAMDARKNALSSILGEEEFGINQAIQLNDLGYNTGTLAQYQKSPEESGGAAAGAVLQALQSKDVHPEVVMAISNGQQITPELMQLQIEYVGNSQKPSKEATPKQALQKELFGAIQSGDPEAIKQAQIRMGQFENGYEEPEPEWDGDTFEGGNVIPMIELSSGAFKLSEKYKDRAETSAEQVSRTRQMLELAKRPETFGSRNTLSKFLTEYAEGTGGVMSSIADLIGKKLADPATPIIDVNTMNQVLKDMSLLGGSDSNEELRQIKSQYMNVKMTPENSVSLLNELGYWAQTAQIASTVKDLSLRSGKPIPGKNAHKYAKRLLSGEVENTNGISLPSEDMRFSSGVDIIKERDKKDDRKSAIGKRIQELRAQGGSNL